MARKRTDTPAGDYWYVVRGERVIAREGDLYLAILSCLGFEADGVTDDLDSYQTKGQDSAAFIPRDDCQATHDRWQEDKKNE
jgi:hypothetical protein